MGKTKSVAIEIMALCYPSQVSFYLKMNQGNTVGTLQVLGGVSSTVELPKYFMSSKDLSCTISRRAIFNHYMIPGLFCSDYKS